MKIEPKTNYTKPAYAIGAAALLAATLFTGCPAEKVKDLDIRRKDPKETKEIELEGVVQYIPDPTEEVQLDGELAPEPTDELELAGETTTTEEFMLEGDVEYIPEPDDEFQLAGDVEYIPEPDDEG